MSEAPENVPAEAPAEATNEKDTRMKSFLADYGELVKKYDFDFASYPVLVPDGTGGFKVIIQSTPVDTSESAKKSPFVSQAE